MTNAIKVLIVDDDPCSLMLLEYLVTALDLEVVTATDVASARKAISQQQFQMAILDVMLPDGDGVQILADIKWKGMPIPVAMLTGTNDPDRLARCKEWRASAVFIKPLDPNLVGEWLEKQHALIQGRECCATE